MEQKRRKGITCSDDLASSVRDLARIMVSILAGLTAAPRSSCATRILEPLREASKHLIPILETLDIFVAWLRDSQAQGISAPHSGSQLFPSEFHHLTRALAQDPSKITGDTNIDGMRMDDLLVELRKLFKTVKYDFENLRWHICTPTGPRSLLCQHLHGVPRIVATLSSLIPRRARSPADEAIMDLSRDFCARFAHFGAWCSGLLRRLQSVVDACRCTGPALDWEEEGKVRLDLQMLLSVDPMARFREAEEAVDRPTT
ncbi:uncharacterized protein SCHCODRAFT_02553717 [Schizophyllum commune H4-8]|uniref:Uncharacterized protein n=1 Tax=Schizophyllum commune (strain H4-8 / FGSC 9210) TaxID=578458 RepID=D8QGI9_SCHCM|nr:uncharacterized protein SCHCODRAFT_02553717 [Schizophyllum commune H4-8]KAI5888087.1 hypothetical protein SCHCODRAFT_02553717 [Schizophyllum commune H4-8]